MYSNIQSEKLSLLPDFGGKVSEFFKRYPDGERCELSSIDPSSTFTDYDVETISLICNEPLVFKLFAHLPGFKDGYTIEHALKFINNAKSNWNENKKYVFIVRNSEGKIVACTDIKSNNLEDAEVGYWASANYPGVMANAVRTLFLVAKKAGYLHLHALIRPENEKSLKVAENAGMTLSGGVEEKGRIYDRFDIDL
jgi:RimJ/RimL family protein N-acetyltransferase